MSEKKHKRKKIFKLIRMLPKWIHILVYISIGSVICLGLYMFAFEKHYENRIYPNVTIDGIPFGGKTKNDVVAYWNARNQPFAGVQFELKFQSTIATFSGSDIELGYDAEFSGTQAYIIGRSSSIVTNFLVKFFRKSVNLTPYFHWRDGVVEDVLGSIAQQVDIPVQDALFHFANNKVTSFRPSKDGQQLNKDESRKRIREAFATVSKTNQQRITILLPVETVRPLISTNSVNSFGIKELVGRGYSEFAGSIPGRIHNVALAASRINGVLIKPGETFSFDDAVGDISAATGYQSAYIIKEGRTVLGDGGGVCQVSSTLFRAAMDAGLPIIERHAHAYRVHYYEEGGFKPGLDATVFSPSVDLKFKNDTPTYILIQTKTDTENLTLTFELYGTRDGRKSEIFNQKVWDQAPPPEALYQDDPTLPKGVVKQVDWEAWGAKASFQYRVTRGDEVLQNTTFYSNFQPWRAVYLRGVQ
jgi:vancomycin resistance protein YoaR